MTTKKNAENKKVKRKSRKPPTPPLKRGVRVKGPGDCVKLINRLINEVLTGDAEETSILAQNKLRTISYSLTVMLKAFECSEIDKRLKNLEDIINKNDDKENGKI